MRDYTKIKAWQLTDDLAVAIYGASQAFPTAEQYGITSQLRRAASSAPANIAEGSSRASKRDYVHFLYIARGSLTESHYFIHLARRLKYLPDEVAEGLLEQAKEALSCLHGLIMAVEQEVGTRTPSSRKTQR